MPYWAHSEVNGHKHDLVEHLTNVAERAACFAAPFNCKELAYWAGLWHDLGKFGSEFQCYINDPKPARGPDHSSAGMVFACGKKADLVGVLIAGHHGGLSDIASLKARLQTKKENQLVIDSLDAALSAGFDIQPAEPLGNILASCTDTKDRLSIETVLRFLFSCLVDADYLDTESHFSPEKTQERGSGVTLQVLWDSLVTAQAPYLRHEGGGVNALRNEIYSSCLETAKEPPGFFSLTVPTGGGKTRSGMAFALSHAIQFSLKRVIVVLPYTSIIEQNVDVYRDIFGYENVLEHHSAVESDDDEEGSELKVRMRLATENWDAPIIVTTTVQFFESLFSNKTSRTRKLHNIAGSVIILDEAQALPEKYLTSIKDMLSRLVSDFGCSVVLSSATQPSLGNDGGAGLLNGIREIAPKPEEYFKRLKRVEYELPGNSETWSWTRVSEEMKASRQALAILNTKRDALTLLDALNDPEALHLSTNMCGAHRREVLEEVRSRLKYSMPCHLISTQVVEAGVDLDFPLVLRALGPLDRIVQAAGRCNREGKLEKGRVVVFEPEKGGCPPGAYKTGTVAASMMLKDAAPDDLHDPAFYYKYFNTLHSAVDMDPDGIQEMRKRLNFPEVAKSFKLIGDDSVPVIVMYKHEERMCDVNRSQDVDKLLSELRFGNPRYIIRKLQPYMVGVYRSKLQGYRKDGLVEEVMPDLYLWRGGYDKVKGIVDTALEPEGLMW